MISTLTPNSTLKFQNQNKSEIEHPIPIAIGTEIKIIQPYYDTPPARHRPLPGDLSIS